MRKVGLSRSIAVIFLTMLVLGTAIVLTRRSGEGGTVHALSSMGKFDSVPVAREQSGAGTARRSPIAAPGASGKARAAVPELVERLQEPDNEVRRSAALALAEIGADAEPALPALREIWKKEKGPVAEAAAQAFEAIRAAVAKRRSGFTVAGGRLSVEVENRPLGQLVADISREARVAVMLAGGVGARQVSVKFSDLAVDEGLRRILAGDDVFFFYGGQGGLEAIWAYPKGRGRSLEPVPPEDWASTQELAAGLGAEDPNERAQAIQALVERVGKGAKDEVLGSLEDPEDQVRTLALYGALMEGVDVPEERLSDLAFNDPSANVRFLALQALVRGPEAEAIVERALVDPSPHIQSFAKAMAARMEKKRRPPGSSEPAASMNQAR